MSNSKWTKTATSASLALLGITQLNNKAQAMIINGGGPISHTGLGSINWTLDAVNGGQATLSEGTSSGGGGSHSLFIKLAQGNTGASFKNALIGHLNGADVGFTPNISVVSQFFSTSGQPVVWGNNETHYVAFIDKHGPATTPIYGWASVTTSANSKNYQLNQWYYENNPGQGICIGATGTNNVTCNVPFDFNALEGIALGMPIFLGLRHLKRRKAKLNTIVSVKPKEKVHPLTLLAMGAAGVRKWREQRARDVA